MLFQASKNQPGVAPTFQQLPLFVYGTLRRGQENYTMLRGYIAHEEIARLAGHSLSVVDGCPMAIPGPHAVVGELLTLTPRIYDHVLAQLDEFEQHPPHRQAGQMMRTQCQVHSLNGRRRAWVYLAVTLPAQPITIISHGDWVKLQHERIAHTRLARYIAANALKGMP